MKPIRVPIIGDDRVSHVLKGINKNISTFGREAMAVGTKLTAAISLPVLAFAGLGVKTSNDLNAALARASLNMNGRIGDITVRLEKLKPALRNLAVDVGISTSKIAENLGLVTTEFGDTGANLEILRINQMAAKGALVDFADALTVTSGVGSAFNKTTAEGVKRITDLTFATAKMGGDTWKEIATGMPQLSLLSSGLNLSMEEMFATVATGGAFLDSTQDKVAAFHGVLSSLQKPTTTMGQLFEHLGVKTGAAMVQKYGFHKALQLVVTKAQEAGVPLGKLIKGAESQVFATKIATEFTGKYNETLDAMIKASGNTEVAFKRQTEGINKLGFSFEKAKVKFENFAGRLGDFLAPVINKAVDAGERLIVKLEQLPRPLKIAAVAVSGFAAVIPPIVLGIGMVATAIGALTAPVWGTIGIIAGAAIVLGGVATFIVLKWGAIKTFFHGMFDFLSKLWHSRITAIVMYTNPITAIARVIINNWTPIKHFFKGLFDWLQEVFGKFSDWVIGWTEKIGNLPFIQALTGVAGSVVGAAGKWLFGSDDNKAFFGNDIAASAQEMRRTEITKKENRVDFYFHNSPKGTHVKQSGAGFMLNDLGIIYGGVQ